MTRPFLPPPLEMLASGEATLIEKIAAEQRQTAATFEAGRARGLEEGLAHGRAEGIATGRAQGQAETEARHATRRQEGPETVQAALTVLLSNRAEDRRALDAEARTALAAMLQILAPTLLAKNFHLELMEILAETLEGRADDIVTLRANPATLTAMEEDGLTPLPERLRLVPDPAMPPRTAEAAWNGGGLLFDADELIRRALAILGASSAEVPSLQEQVP